MIQGTEFNSGLKTLPPVPATKMKWAFCQQNISCVCFPNYESSSPIQVNFNHKPRMDVLNITALNYVSCLTLEIFQGGGHTRDPSQKWKPDVLQGLSPRSQAPSSKFSLKPRPHQGVGKRIKIMLPGTGLPYQQQV